MHTEIGNDIKKARILLINGDVVAIPTETVYGLAGNALDEDAVLKIFEAKNRPSFNPLIVHVGSWDTVEEYVAYIPAKAKLLAKKFTPGPLTFLLQKKNIIPDLVTAGSAKVAIRIPNHLLTHQLLSQLIFPCKPCCTCIADTGLTYPKGFALGAAKGKFNCESN